ncbi:ThuA domain-containing protein [Sphaerisporangium fuscum]|uniref:ThuA domain-containing protein n=1 Tax=Sphaerisporangium fuscum TaxID=2835868 RepID=UPI001BDDAE91|nr:ThuA domain-containing protein [Sphaerisporangium fuscum]
MKLRSSPAAMVVVDGTDIHHDLIGAALALQEMVVEAGIPAARAVGTDRFADPMPATAEADVYVLYRSGVRFDPLQQKALSDLVAGGKGLVALHASNLFGFGKGGIEADREAFALVGSRFLSHGDDGLSEGRLEVKVREGHPVTRYLDDFGIDDEFYVLEYAGDVEVLAERQAGAGTEPVAYARRHGAGRVCYIALGHDARAWGNPGFRQLVRQATLWAAGVPDEEIASWSTRWPLGNGRTIGGGA